MSRIRFLALDSKRTQLKKGGGKLPPWLAKLMKLEAELAKRLEAQAELAMSKPIPVELPIGEFAWHEAKERGKHGRDKAQG